MQPVLKTENKLRRSHTSVQRNFQLLSCAQKKARQRSHRSQPHFVEGYMMLYSHMNAPDETPETVYGRTLWYFSPDIRVIVHDRKSVAHQKNISDRLMLYFHYPRVQVCQHNVSTGSSRLVIEVQVRSV